MIVVVGGTKGIGLAIAGHYAAAGRTVVVGYASDEAAAEAAEEQLAAGPGAAHFVRADVGTDAGCAEIARRAAALGEPVRGLVHCAVWPLAGATLELEPEDLARAVRINGLSLHGLVRALLDQFEPGSSVVYLSSRGGRTVVPGYAAVGLGKAVAESLVRYLATEMAPRGVRVNAVAPSIVDTGAVRALFGDQAEALVARAAATNPSGRGVAPEDYIGVIDFLMSPAAGFVQGQVISVNGGANLSA